MSLNSRYGTYRGFVRLVVSHIQILLVSQQDLSVVKRLVFVCRGNICRSAYADAVASLLGFPSASFGLRTASGRNAHDPVIKEASSRGISLATHRSVAADEFVRQPGDLYLVMETRQIGDMRRIAAFRNSPVDLLGRYGGRPHLHDPYGLGREFTATSLNDIDRSVRSLVHRIRQAQKS